MTKTMNIQPARLVDEDLQRRDSLLKQFYSFEEQRLVDEDLQRRAEAQQRRNRGATEAQ